MAKKQEQTTQAQPEQVSQVEAAAQGREQQEPQGQQTHTNSAIERTLPLQREHD